MVVGRRVGRPAKCGVEGSVVTLTVRLPAGVKNWLVGEALAYDLSLSEMIVLLVDRAR